jgi:hypothetical protein
MLDIPVLCSEIYKAYRESGSVEQRETQMKNFRDYLIDETGWDGTAAQLQRNEPVS